LGSLVALAIGLLNLIIAKKLPAGYFGPAKYLPLGMLAYNKNLKGAANAVQPKTTKIQKT